MNFSYLYSEIKKPRDFTRLTQELGVRELTNNNLPEPYHFPMIFKTQINAEFDP
jgi:hypothetical protein